MNGGRPAGFKDRAFGKFRLRNVCPLEVKRPWNWKNRVIDGVVWAEKAPGKVEIPRDFLSHWDWSTLHISGKAPAPFGTCSMKAVFTTQCRFLGVERVLERQESLDEVGTALFSWNQRLFDSLPPYSLEYFVLGDDCAGNSGLLFSLETWRKWLRPHWEALFALASDKGCALAFHSDGDILDLLPELREMGVRLVICQAVGRMAEQLLKPERVPEGMELQEGDPWNLLG